MTVASILVPIRGDGKGENVLGHAASIGRRFNAHITALHSRPRPEQMFAGGISIPASFRKQMLEAASGLADFTESGLREHLEKAMARFGIAHADRIPDARAALTLDWREVTGKQAETIKVHGRLADMIAVAQPDHDANLGMNTLQSALFDTGRPVLMCPPTETIPEALGSRVVLAWSGTAENARAVAMTLPVIEAAETVTVLTIGEAVTHASAEELVEYLALRGITASVRKVADSRDVGETLLSEAASAGDLLIMGAYSRSHAREVVFGGATQHVVDEATMPVLMVH